MFHILVSKKLDCVKNLLLIIACISAIFSWVYNVLYPLLVYCQYNLLVYVSSSCYDIGWRIFLTIVYQVFINLVLVTNSVSNRCRNLFRFCFTCNSISCLVFGWRRLLLKFGSTFLLSLAIKCEWLKILDVDPWSCLPLATSGCFISCLQLFAFCFYIFSYLIHRALVSKKSTNWISVDAVSFSFHFIIVDLFFLYLEAISVLVT